MLFFIEELCSRESLISLEKLHQAPQLISEFCYLVAGKCLVAAKMPV